MFECLSEVAFILRGSVFAPASGKESDMNLQDLNSAELGMTDVEFRQKLPGAGFVSADKAVVRWDHEERTYTFLGGKLSEITIHYLEHYGLSAVKEKVEQMRAELGEPDKVREGVHPDRDKTDDLYTWQKEGVKFTLTVANLKDSDDFKIYQSKTLA